ncbi:YesL family protein [Ornithinibacillus salinisoli]|uniref:YesL family protein n=1 Tax=Ornithinibacillus salinisoli TaxID=1848459 RepID=A0ABW4W2L1_9BACI
MTIVSTILEAFEWFMRLVRLNLVFLLACLSGFVLFSFFPAIVAAFAVADQWTKGNTDISVWKEFWKHFKANYVRSQLVGYIIGLAVFIIYVDFTFFQQLDGGMIKTPIMMVLAILLLGIAITALYIFPTLLTHDIKLKDLFRTSFFTGLSYIHWSMINLLGIVGILLVSYRFPGTLFFLTGSSIVLWMTCMNQIIKSKVERRYEQLKSVAE